MSDFLAQLKEGLGDANGNSNSGSNQIAAITSCPTQDYPVLAEMSIRSTELHKIANGDCCTLSDGALGIRFLLKESFKVRNSNFVVNTFAIQIVALGKKNVMHKENIAVKTKIKQVIREKIIKAKPRKEIKEATQSTLGKEEVY